MCSISKYGLDFLAQQEAFRNKAYRDSVGIWTIGYGTTHINGGPVRPGMTCTMEQALKWKKDDVDRMLASAIRYINADKRAKLNQCQIDAIASLVYNIGVGGWATSSVLRYINRGNFEAAGDKFLLWNKGKIKGKKVVIRGLVLRRQRERKLFLSDCRETEQESTKTMEKDLPKKTRSPFGYL